MARSVVLPRSLRRPHRCAFSFPPYLPLIHNCPSRALTPLSFCHIFRLPADTQAIYPVVIVVLVALNQSQLEHGLAGTYGPARSLSTWAAAFSTVSAAVTAADAAAWRAWVCGGEPA